MFTTSHWKRLLLTIPIVLAVLISACRSAKEPVTIRLIGEAYAPLDALTKMKGAFEQKTGIKVEVIQKDHQAVVSELDQELSSRRVTYDLMLMPHRLLGKLAEHPAALGPGPGDQGVLAGPGRGVQQQRPVTVDGDADSAALLGLADGEIQVADPQSRR